MYSYKPHVVERCDRQHIAHSLEEQTFSALTESFEKKTMLEAEQYPVE